MTVPLTRSRSHEAARQARGRRCVVTGQGRSRRAAGMEPRRSLSKMDAPEFKRDLKHVADECRAFAAAYRGNLAAMLAGKKGAAALHAAIARYEKLDEVMGKLMSYRRARLRRRHLATRCAPSSTATRRSVTDHVGPTVVLPARAQPARRRGADQPRRSARPRRITGPGSRTSRREKPHQLDDQIEKAVPGEIGRPAPRAWNRLFDETIASLRFEVDGEKLTLEPTLKQAAGRDEQRCEARRQSARRRRSRPICALRLITNTLAKDKEISDRWRRFKDIADARHLSNRVEREVVEALVAAVQGRLSAPVASLLQAEGALVRQGAARSTGIATRHCPSVVSAPIPGTRRATPCSTHIADSRRDMAEIARRFFDEGWIDAPVRPGKAPGAFAHPTVPSAHPYVLVNYQGKPRDVMTLAHELGHGVHQVLAARTAR